jgi:hypothetical protein
MEIASLSLVGMADVSAATEQPGSAAGTNLDCEKITDFMGAGRQFVVIGVLI